MLSIEELRDSLARPEIKSGGGLILHSQEFRFCPDGLQSSVCPSVLFVAYKKTQERSERA